ncbi:hypothetical protein R5R35_004879 [Gryllus longicercus]|uniref:Cytochrome P450 n=1 Tax=Gryllus longicercus TaxID=2509291 RepID=A0AAN9VB79_9ORTH
MLYLVIPAMVLLLLFLVPHYWLHLSRAARLVSSIPGPKPLPLIGNTLEFGYGTVDIIANMTRLWKEYGHVFKIWLGPHLFIVVADAKYMEHFLSSNTNITKNMTYGFLEPWLGTGLLTSTGSKWKHHRKIITPTFHFKILEQFVEVFNNSGNVMIQKLKKEVNGGEFDIYNYITLCALDSICETAMGVSMNVQNDGNSEYVSALQGLADLIMKRTFIPWLFPKFIFDRSELGKLQKGYLKILHDTTNKVIADRKRELAEKHNDETSDETFENEIGQKKKLAFLDLLLQYTKGEGNLTDEEIREEVDTFMFEGHDTTASAMSFCLLLLSKNLECQEIAYAELKEIFGNSDREATMKDLQDMKYLECVIKESLRIYPSVPFFARLLDEDVHIDGVHIVKGTNILLSPVFLHRNQSYFPDPEKFDPDRFSAENIQGRNPYVYLPFSAGPRNCIGQKFAMMEMKSTISKVLRNFKLSPGSKEVVLSAELVLRNWGGIFLKLQNRE